MSGFGGAGEYLDHSACAVRAFRRWCGEKHSAQIEDLNAAWKTKFKDFDSVTPPGIAERAARDHGFRGNTSNRWALDWDRFVLDTTTSRMRRFANLCKEETRHQKLVGVFYGYVDDISGYLEALQMQGCGHGAMVDIVDDPNIDFFCQPPELL